MSQGVTQLCPDESSQSGRFTEVFDLVSGGTRPLRPTELEQFLLYGYWYLPENMLNEIVPDRYYEGNSFPSLYQNHKWKEICDFVESIVPCGKK